MKKFSTSDIQKWIPAVDHPALNGLRNGFPGKVSIPVALYQDDTLKFSAEVQVYGHTYSLFVPALAMVLETLRERNIELEWNAAVFTAPHKKFPRQELEADMTGATLAAYMKQYRKMDLDEAIIDSYKSLQSSRKEGLSPEEEKRLLDDSVLKLCAAVLASGVEIKSDDLKKLTPRRGFFDRLKGFKP